MKTCLPHFQKKKSTQPSPSCVPEGLLVWMQLPQKCWVWVGMWLLACWRPSLTPPGQLGQSLKIGKANALCHCTRKEVRPSVTTTGIAFLSILGKVFAKAILHRLKPRAELLLRESQCNFRQGRGCADQLFSLRIMIKKLREYHQPIYVCFIDLKRRTIQCIITLSGAFFNIPTSCQRSCWLSSKPCMRTLLLQSELMERHLTSSQL